MLLQEIKNALQSISEFNIEEIIDVREFLDWVRDASFFRIELTSEKTFGGICFLDAKSRIL